VQYTSGGFKRFDLAEFKRLVTEQIAIPEKLGSMEGGCNMIRSGYTPKKRNDTLLIIEQRFLLHYFQL
jgi:hypothetical protein